MPFDPSPLQIACADGAHIDASRYCGGDRAAVLIAPALGVPRRFYQAFAQFYRFAAGEVANAAFRHSVVTSFGIDVAKAIGEFEPRQQLTHRANAVRAVVEGGPAQAHYSRHRSCTAADR